MADDFGACLADGGGCWQVGTLTNLLRLSDADGSGTIDFDEFAAIVNACH